VPLSGGSWGVRVRPWVHFQHHKKKKKKSRNPNTGLLDRLPRPRPRPLVTLVVATPSAGGPCRSGSPALSTVAPSALQPRHVSVSTPSWGLPCSPVQGMLCTGRHPSPLLSLGLTAVGTQEGQDKQGEVHDSHTGPPWRPRAGRLPSRVQSEPQLRPQLPVTPGGPRVAPAVGATVWKAPGLVCPDVALEA
jgi:hypothetical protein